MHLACYWPKSISRQQLVGMILHALMMENFTIDIFETNLINSSRVQGNSLDSAPIHTLTHVHSLMHLLSHTQIYTHAYTHTHKHTHTHTTGYLEKKARGSKWQKRYFWVQDHCLVYRTSKTSSDVSNKRIDLRQVVQPRW